MIEEFARKHNIPKYRINQFNKQFYGQYIKSFDELTNWPKDLREKLKHEVCFSTLTHSKEFVSTDGNTVKVLFRRLDEVTAGEVHNASWRKLNKIESVLMRHKDGRNTVCVSCMVGCPVNCSFCATGKLGFHGNLSAREIVDQVMYFKRYLHNLSRPDRSRGTSPVNREGDRVTNVVFMGMGEPMLNLKEVQNAIDIMSDPKKLAMSERRITVSTSGYIPPLKKFIEDGFKGRLAISLHAPNQEIREKLMPVAKVYKLGDLMKVLDEFVKKSNKRVTYEYILIRGVNDQREHALEVSKLLKGRLAHLNLIPYNPIPEASFVKPSKNNIRKFTEVLKAQEINYTVRVTMGDDVNAACGQLAAKENGSS